MSNKTRISGFTVIRNGIRQGYPFVESILSVLPICDEFLISDGYSTDGTWEVLVRLRKKHGKIKLYQDEWKISKAEELTGKLEKKGAVLIGKLTNKLKERCNGEYCLYLQADEVYHEDTLAEIKRLPKRYPDIDLFYFPMLSLIGEFVYSRDYWPVRFLKNKKEIKSFGDGWTFCYSTPKIILRYILNPINLRRKLLFSTDMKTLFVDLRYPVFHFHALFPKNYEEKIKSHINTIKREEYKKALKIFSKTHSFESLVTTFFNSYEKYKGPYPKIIRPILGKQRYEVREELIS